jgi:replication fork protection complex subunit Csm3/Swi3
MPSAVPSKSAPLQHDAIDNYDVGDLSDDPFASPSPESASKKRKEPDSGLGIDEEVSVQKRARVPNVKLDENRYVASHWVEVIEAF